MPFAKLTYSKATLNFIGAFPFGLLGTVLFAVRGLAEMPFRPLP